jgi:hypothetical protein
VKFRDDVSFIRATFFSFAEFVGATFSHTAEFERAAFCGGALFERAMFAETASFRSAAFFNEARFNGAAFEREIEFVNADMQDKSWFEQAVFKTVPPEFFSAKLHEGTVWPCREAWPIPNEPEEAKKFICAYERLKLEMDRLKKHEDELDFFALELQSRRVELGTWKGLPIVIYGRFSDYGRSYLRPLVALIVVAAIGAVAFWYFDARTLGEALGLSSANTLNVFGFRRDFSLSIETPFAWLKILAAAQTILGAILLFLFGLGIRNKFRMK